MDITLRPVARVRGGRTEPSDDDWERETARIVLEDGIGPESLVGLESFSHLIVVYLFHLVDEADVVWGARRPRGRADWPEVGIFAQRGRVRPNRLGVTTCTIESVEGATVQVRGLDAVDGTPVLDLKPHMTGFDPRGQVRQPAWAEEIMSAYWSG